MTVFPQKGRRWGGHDSWLLRHSLSLVLLALLVVQSIVYHFTELPDWTSEQMAHGESTALWPAYWLHYTAEWFVSVLADTYGALLLVVLTKWFYEQGSDQGKDLPDETAAEPAGS